MKVSLISLEAVYVGIVSKLVCVLDEKGEHLAAIPRLSNGVSYNVGNLL